MKMPTPPIEFGTELNKVRSRLQSKARSIPDSFVKLLEQKCEKVSSDSEQLAQAGRDWWPLALHWSLEGEVPAMPQIVASPKNTKQVADVLKACTEAEVPVTAFGGRSGVCGSSVPILGGVALDMGLMEGMVDLDTDSMIAKFLPGTYGPDVEIALRKSGYTLGHWPQSIAISTVGGWLACRGAGQYSTRYGKIDDMVLGLEVVLANGQIIKTGNDAPKNSAGPDLTQLFVGSEGTLGIITQGTFRIHPVPQVERRVAFGFQSFAEGMDACRRILRRGATPCVLRLYDEVETKRNFDVDNSNLLIVLDEGDEIITDASMAVVEQECSSAKVMDVELVAKWLEHRNDTSALQTLTKLGIVVDTIEIAAKWGALEDIRKQVISKLNSIEGNLNASVHQSHSYTSGACLYFTFAGNAPDGCEDRGQWNTNFYKQSWQRVMEATLELGGTISHHHGIGLLRSPFMKSEMGEGALKAFADIKSVLDPNGILNPGKLGLTSNLGVFRDIFSDDSDG